MESNVDGSNGGGSYGSDGHHNGKGSADGSNGGDGNHTDGDGGRIMLRIL